MIHSFRLEYGTDLRLGIEEYCLKHNIKSMALITCVGCVYTCNIRLADGKSIYNDLNNYEIVSLCGTSSVDGSHLHISLANIKANVIGGHLCYGTFVNTTAEIVILEIENSVFSRQFDENTGYNELVIKEIIN